VRKREFWKARSWRVWDYQEEERRKERRREARDERINMDKREKTELETDERGRNDEEER
jgi:hypothetical protein